MVGTADKVLRTKAGRGVGISPQRSVHSSAHDAAVNALHPSAGSSASRCVPGSRWLLVVSPVRGADQVLGVASVIVSAGGIVVDAVVIAAEGGEV